MKNRFKKVFNLFLETWKRNDEKKPSVSLVYIKNDQVLIRKVVSTDESEIKTFKNEIPVFESVEIEMLRIFEDEPVKYEIFPIFNN